MTNIFQQAINWVEAEFTAEEQAVVDFLSPLANEIYQAALVLGKQDLAAGLQVIKDSVVTAVQAGTAAIEAGLNPVTAAETTFLTTAAAEGATAVSNAMSGAIKAGVALEKQAAAALTSALTPAAPADPAAPTAA